MMVDTNEMINVTTSTGTPLLIIGAALPRTGTTSIARALERLGYHVFHATTWNRTSMTPLWNDLVDADNAKNETLYKELFNKFVHQLSIEGFNATLDQPSCFVYEQLMEYYPDAQILNVQRNPESWAKSMVEMAYGMDIIASQPPHSLRQIRDKGPFGMWSKQQLGYQPEEIYRHGVPFNGTNYLESKSSISLKSAKKAYLRYQAKVKETMPSEKLITYNVKDGWKTLCDHFLRDGDTCPSELGIPFPRVNTRENGFLLDWRIRATIQVWLYNIHPNLSQQNWLTSLLLFVYKRRRSLVFTSVLAALTKLLFSFAFQK